MADKRITSRSKVYITRIGLKDWLVAADSQKAALRAWDVHRNLFAEGAARVTNDPAHVGLAMKSPGVPVAATEAPVTPRIPASKPRHLDGKKRAAGNVMEFPVSLRPRDQRPVTPRRDRSKLAAAELELQEFERTSARERASLEKRRLALESELEAFQAETDRRRIRLMKRIKREKAALHD